MELAKKILSLIAAMSIFAGSYALANEAVVPIDLLVETSELVPVRVEGSDHFFDALIVRPNDSVSGAVTGYKTFR